MKKLTTALTILLATALSVPVLAAAPYDDLYYVPSKSERNKQAEEIARKKAQKEAERQAALDALYANYTTVDLPGADTYTVASTKPLSVDVDTYNRRSATVTTVKTDTAAVEDGEFAYTRRLERFHNPDVVVATGDKDLIGLYYDNDPEVNIYLVNNDPWYSPYYYNSWYTPGWGFSLGYNPWYGPSFGLSWSWNWGWNGWYDPWFYPSYRPGWGGPGWAGPGWGPVAPPPPMRPGRPAWASHAPGASRPNVAPAVGGAGRRPGSNVANGNVGSRRPGTPGLNNAVGNRRPGTTLGNHKYQPATNTTHKGPETVLGRRPYEGGSVNRPSGTQGNTRPSGSVVGNRRVSNGSSSGSGRTNSTVTNSNRGSNNNSYRPSNSGNNRGSSYGGSSFGGSSNRGGSFGGGANRGGGASHGGGGPRGGRR